MGWWAVKTPSVVNLKLVSLKKKTRQKMKRGDTERHTKSHRWEY